MNLRRWLNLVLLGVTLFVGSNCYGQTYQGPSGGRGGRPFDHWKESNEARDIKSVSLLIDNQVIRCISVIYRDGRQTKSGYCDPGGRLGIDGWKFFSLDPDEYIIGISGHYGDRINSLRFYTSKKTTPVYGGGGTVEFGYTSPSGQKIAAFIGRAGDNLDAIGVLYAPK